MSEYLVGPSLWLAVVGLALTRLRVSSQETWVKSGLIIRRRTGFVQRVAQFVARFAGSRVADR